MPSKAWSTTTTGNFPTKAARRARNIRFAVIVGVAGAVGSTIWALWPDSETEKALKRAIALVPTTWRTTPDDAILDSLSDLIDSTDSNEAIVSTIRGLGCDSAYALWTYVFKTNDEEG